MKCTACHKSLADKLDTFGTHDLPFCWGCWSDMHGYDEQNCDVMQRNNLAMNIPRQIELLSSKKAQLKCCYPCPDYGDCDPVLCLKFHGEINV